MQSVGMAGCWLRGQVKISPLSICPISLNMENSSSLTLPTNTGTEVAVPWFSRGGELPFATAPRQAPSLDSKINLLQALLEVKPVGQERAGSGQHSGDSAQGQGGKGKWWSSSDRAVRWPLVLVTRHSWQKEAPGVLILVAWLILESDTESLLMKNHYGRSRRVHTGKTLNYPILF